MKISTSIRIITVMLLYTATVAADEPNQPAKLNKKPLTAAEKLDRALLEQALGKKKTEQSANENPLEEIIKRMEAAEQEIIARNTGRKTQQLQKQVVTELDKLITQLEKRQQNMQVTQRSRPSNQPPNPDKQSSEDKPTGEKPKEKPENPENGENKHSKTNSDSSKESANEKRTAKGEQPEALRKEALEKDVWGHLPPTLRRKLLNVYSEKYLPQYNELVRRYFESLAEESKSKK